MGGSKIHAHMDQLFVVIHSHFKEDDWKDFQEIAISKESSAYAYADFTWPTDENHAKDSCSYMATDDDMWAIEIKETGKVICFVNFNSINDENILDIGHVMNMEYGNQGYEYEGLKCLYEYAFDQLSVAGIKASWAKGDADKLEPLIQLGMKTILEWVGDAFDESGRKYEGCTMMITSDEWHEK